MNEKSYKPILGFPKYFLCDDGFVYILDNKILKPNKESRVTLYVKGKKYNRTIGRLISENHKPINGNSIPIAGFDGYFLNDKGQVTRDKYKKINYQTKYTKSSSMCIAKKDARLKRGNKYYRVSYENIINRANNRISDFQALVGIPNYFLDKEGKVYNSNYKEMTCRRGLFSLSVDGMQVSVPRSVINAQISGLLDRIIRIKESPNYFIDNEGNIYNKIFKKKKPIFVNMRGVPSLVMPLWDGEKNNTRSLQTIIGNNLLKDKKEDSWCVGFYDEDKLNCKPNNLYWMSYQDYCLRISARAKLRNTFTKDYALKNCKCPILISYYESGDISIIENLFEDLEIKIYVDYWDDVKADIYLDIVDRARRYALLKPIHEYIRKIMKYYKHRYTNNVWEFKEWGKRKVSLEKRVTVDDMEFESA